MTPGPLPLAPPFAGEPAAPPCTPAPALPTPAVTEELPPVTIPPELTAPPTPEATPPEPETTLPPTPPRPPVERAGLPPVPRAAGELEQPEMAAKVSNTPNGSHVVLPRPLGMSPIYPSRTETARHHAVRK
jgi:hypothetical protein